MLALDNPVAGVARGGAFESIVGFVTQLQTSVTLLLEKVPARQAQPNAGKWRKLTADVCRVTMKAKKVGC